MRVRHDALVHAWRPVADSTDVNNDSIAATTTTTTTTNDGGRGYSCCIQYVFSFTATHAAHAATPHDKISSAIEGVGRACAGTRHTMHVTRQTACVARDTVFAVNRTALCDVEHRRPHDMQDAPHITHHKARVTYHTSHVTHHTSHASNVTRHSVLHGTGVVRPPCPSPNNTPRYLHRQHHSTPKPRTEDACVSPHLLSSILFSK